MPGRQYDVVLYGATGFTGKQTAQYFARHAPAGQVRWAIAGRNRQKLEAVKAQLGAPAASVDVLVADSGDQAAVDAIVAQTRVMLNTAGPFALCGGAIVDACVRLKTHYADITGETPWVRDLIDRYHEQAASDGTRIIPMCGFDSVPSDLGACLVVRHMQKMLGVPCREVAAYFQLYGGFNGGTLASALNLYDSGEAVRMRDLFLLSPTDEHTAEQIRRSRDPTLPAYDASIGAWVGPYFMAPINSRVVRRSAALFDQWQAPYGAQFSYREFIKYGRTLGWLTAGGVTAGLALFDAALRPSLTRRLLKTLLPQPGSGPAERTLNEGWFRCEFLGVAEDGRRLRGLVRDEGDPGNRVTVKCLCESALALAVNTQDLPGGPRRGGVLTPATGLGDVLTERLRKAGMVIELA
jgi:short subunit dehydrogenase-like uncharacterized protein